jgi:uncharacterized protein
MIVEFSLGNFFSFYEIRKMSFVPKGLSEHKQNIFKINDQKLLKSSVIYGANSSGKSNFIKGFDRMRRNILNSVKLNDSDELDFYPFLLAENSENEPTFFEVIFITENKRYRYGFEYNSQKIINEWLYQGKNSKNENPLFIRTVDGIGVSELFNEGKEKEESTNDNRLFLSLVAQLGGRISKQIIEWFKNCNVLSGIEHNDYKAFSTRMFHKNMQGSAESIELFKKLNLGFQEIKAIESDFNPLDLPKDFPDSLRNKLFKDLEGKKRVTLKTIHFKYDNKGRVIDKVLLDKNDNESDGSNKIIDLSGPLFDTLLNGRFLLIDELDAKLHPLITCHIVGLFNNPETNPKNAQLVFATHDTNLLSSDLFRRDQIWFTEKDSKEQTDIYPLSSIELPDGSKVRNDSNLERNYIRGRYGAIPFITA